MGTATSSRVALAVSILVLGVAGCGGADHGAFGWLRPRPAPSGWAVTAIPTGATLPYPPQWRLARGDRGTATAVLQDARSRFLGYLNITPRQSEETLGNWTSFRPRHNEEEGNHDVVVLAAARGLRFRTGHGACVRDAYTTSIGVRYIELACLVTGAHGSTVIVGAAPPSAWTNVSPLLERAISAFTT